MMEETVFGYRLEAEISRTEQCVLYQALDLTLGRKVTLRRIPSRGRLDLQAADRCLQRARAAARLSHPVIPEIYQAGELEGQVFIVMEPLDGESLESSLDRPGAATFQQKLEVMIQISRALAMAHDHELVHGSVQPGSIQIGKDGLVKLLDFDAPRLPCSHYLAPEQVQPEAQVDRRCDLFSLGVLFHRWVSGEFPIPAPKGEFEHVPANLADFQISPLFQNASLELQDCLNRLLKTEPTKRLADGNELAAALERLQQALPVETDRLRGKTADLRSQLEKRWEEATQVGEIPGLYDAQFFRVKKVEGAGQDYSSLLQTCFGLEQILGQENDRRKTAIRIHRLLSAGRSQIDGLDFEGCRRTVSQILELHPENNLALQLRTSCEDAFRFHRDSSVRIQAALATAQLAFFQGADDSCLAALDRLLENDPDHSEALILRKRVVERQESEIERLTKLAEEKESEDLETCLELVEKALKRGSNEDLIGIESRVRRRIALRDERFAAHLSAGETRFQSGDYLEASHELQQALRLCPENRGAKVLQRKIEETLSGRRQRDELLAEARHLLSTRAYGPCSKLAQRGLRLDPEHSELNALVQRSEAELRKATEQQRSCLEALLTLGRGETESGLPTDARTNTEFALLLAPEFSAGPSAKGGSQTHSEEGLRAGKAPFRDSSPPMFQTSQLGSAVGLGSRWQAAARDWLERIRSADLAVGNWNAGDTLRDLRRSSGLKALKKRLADSNPVLMLLGMALLVLLVTMAIPGRAEAPIEEPVAPASDDQSAGWLGISSTPWALVQSVVRVSDGQQMQVKDCSTPCWIPLPAGEYRVRLGNRRFPGLQEIEESFLVQPGVRNWRHLRLPRSEEEGFRSSQR